ncbi:MAG: hypothetical protein QM728_12650 [Gordonia sp. (in: high G+C Gram-positive bacteria)]|uniref:hypothetical protein n=1 Tax=Gordonia sp. (in: high G+C Gram-positive bacteria) TaxID=84139 RepID=UPI0039E531A0
MVVADAADVQPFHSIYLVDDDGRQIPLFEGVLDFDDFHEWCVENEESIKAETLPPFPVRRDESLSAAYQRAQEAAPYTGLEVADDDPDFLYEVLVDEWGEAHTLAWSREWKLPGISMGTGIDGPEISCEPRPPDDDEAFTGAEWRWRYYPVNLHEFFEWLRTEHGSTRVYTAN